jgi:peptidyl-prolyl cis-trans isomerase-like 4
MSVLIETSLGDVVVDLFVSRCPLASKNFLKLCKAKYYNGVLFFSVKKDFIAQTGDPTGTGTGGVSFQGLSREGPSHFTLETFPKVKHDRVGLLGMSHSGKDLNSPNGSQFYVTLRKEIDYLDGKFTIFGSVEEDESNVIERLNNIPVDKEMGRPYTDIRILHTLVLEDPFPDSDEFLRVVPPASPKLPAGIPRSEQVPRRLAYNDGTADAANEGASSSDAKRKRDADSAAKTLEILGDLPSVDTKPPDTVLFVCKLNPVTDSESLELIFSRFGTVKKCDVVMDWKTGESLQYAFVEFETEEACTEAYLKMNNVKIDDRRIQVDFSQSVSKEWSNYKRSNQKVGKSKPSNNKRRKQ